MPTIKHFVWGAIFGFLLATLMWFPVVLTEIQRANCAIQNMQQSEKDRTTYYSAPHEDSDFHKGLEY